MVSAGFILKHYFIRTDSMPKHSHEFVEDYNGFVGFGFDRPTDEASLIVYLQKFSDDALMAVLRQRLGDEDIDGIVDMISGLLTQTSE